MNPSQRFSIWSIGSATGNLRDSFACSGRIQSSKPIDERVALPLTSLQPFIRRQTIDVTLDLKEGLDPLHGSSAIGENRRMRAGKVTWPQVLSSSEFVSGGGFALLGG